MSTRVKAKFLFRLSAIAYEIGRYSERMCSIFPVSTNKLKERFLGRWRRYIATSSASELHRISCAEGTYKVETHVAC